MSAGFYLLFVLVDMFPPEKLLRVMSNIGWEVVSASVWRCANVGGAVLGYYCVVLNLVNL